MSSRFAVALLVFIAAASLTAQTVDVSLAPQTARYKRVYKRHAFEWAVGAIRFAASGSTVELQGFSLAIFGDMDGLHSTKGVQAWLDNGNGTWDTEPADTKLATRGGAPVVSFVFAPIQILPGSSIDIWIRCDFTGSALGNHYDFELTAPGEVLVSGGAVAFGTPFPKFGFNIFDSNLDQPSCGVATLHVMPPPMLLALAGVVILCALWYRRRMQEAEWAHVAL